MEGTVKMSALTEKKLFVPGRLCLFGEHSDWAGGYRTIDRTISVGYCLATGINHGIYATASRHPNQLIVVSKLPNGKTVGPEPVYMHERQLLETAKNGSFFSYCAGTAYYIHRKFLVGGLTLYNHMDLPLKKGLSSSAAINVLVARAFNQLYGLGLTIEDEMEFAYQGEILTGSECGRMDQVCAYGAIPVFLAFDGNDVQIEKLRPQRTIHMVIVDLQAGKNTKKILADLNHCFINGDGKIAEGLRYALGAGNARILKQAKQAVADSDSEAIGAFMCEAQEMFDCLVAPVCPSELKAPKLHQVLEYPPIQELIWGGKGVGSQGDGSAQFVARGQEEQREIIRRLEKLNVRCLTLEIEASD